MTVALLVVIWGLRLLIVLGLLYVALFLVACLVADLRGEPQATILREFDASLDEQLTQILGPEDRS